MRLVLQMTLDEFLKYQNCDEKDYDVGDYAIFKSEKDDKWYAREILKYGVGYNRDEFQYGYSIPIQII